MNRFVRWYYIGQALGWDNLPRRVWQIAKGRLGLSQRALPGGALSAEAMRRQFVDDYDPASAGERWARRGAALFGGAVGPVELAQVADDETWGQRVTHVSDQLRDGWMLMYGRHYALSGFPPEFNRDPLHDVTWPTPRHWSTYQQFDPRYDDLKCVWEASRFSWAYHLTRGHVRAPAEGLDATWWACLDAWDEQNPYGLTPNWACGQEATFRLFAWLLAATRMPAGRTAAQWDRLTQLVWYTGRHIEGNINYARSQKNNHAISEAIGMWAIGLLFPELRRAAQWRGKGLRILAAEVGRQVAADGSYVQNSINYHRVMLDDLLWAAALAGSSGTSLPAVVVERARPALAFLLEMIDPDSGQCPNYGMNDGAQVLPLSTCDYTDFRPVAQAAHYWLHGTRCFPAGPWDEKMLWLFGPESLAAEVTPRRRTPGWSAPQGGYYTFQGARCWGMTRCHAHRDRPGQADMLHLDLWYDGLNLFRDAGSYSYYCDKPLQEYFKSTAAHNTVTVDDEDQMILGPRFLWLRWTRGRVMRAELSRSGRVADFVGRHDGYTRLKPACRHTRRIVRIDDSFVVIDHLAGARGHVSTLRWRIGAADWQPQGSSWSAPLPSGRVVVDIFASDEQGALSPCVPEMLRGQIEPRVEGWESRYYADKEAVPVLRATVDRGEEHYFVTTIRYQEAGRFEDRGGPAGAVRVSRGGAHADACDSFTIAGLVDAATAEAVRDECSLILEA